MYAKEDIAFVDKVELDVVLVTFDPAESEEPPDTLSVNPDANLGEVPEETKLNESVLVPNKSGAATLGS